LFLSIRHAEKRLPTMTVDIVYIVLYAPNTTL
jgi:hypothetical protein